MWSIVVGFFFPKMSTLSSLEPVDMLCKWQEEFCRLQTLFIYFLAIPCGMWDAGSEFPVQGSNLCPLPCERGVLTTGPPVKSWSIVVLFCFLIFLAVPHGMWDLISPARDRTHAPCIGSAESSPVDLQGSPPYLFNSGLCPRIIRLGLILRIAILFLVFVYFQPTEIAMLILFFS